MAALQLGFWRVFSADRCRALTATASGRALLLSSVLLEASANAGFAALVAASPSPIAEIVSMIMLCGCMTAIVVLSHGLRFLFLALSAPCVAAMTVGVPVIIYLKGGSLADAGVLGGAGLVLFAASYMMWGRFAALLQAEADARVQIKAAMQGKSAFLATVSHELRTPISAMQAGAIAIQRNAESLVQRSNAALIVDSGRMMRKLLDDLLDFAKLEAHRLTVEDIVFNYRDAIRSAVPFWAPEARKKGIAFRLSGAHAAPAWVCGDPLRLRQVLNNLLSNALKVTDHGSVTLTLSQAGGAWVMSVTDTGPGLTEAQQGRLFEAFVQAHATVARTHGGTGLGWAISRELAQLMGGDLTVSSTSGLGSTISLRLPLSPAEALSTPAAQAPGLERTRSLQVLAADDHEVNRRALALLLGDLDIDLQIVDDGGQALDALAAQVFDFVLLDVNMPAFNGFEVARRVRDGSGPNRGTPIIGVTGAAGEGDIRRCLEAGMTAVVAKPIEPAALLAAIDQALSTVGATQATAEVA